jgi:hypothetical protein
VLFIKYFNGDRIKEGKMGGDQGPHEEEEKFLRSFG